jgi:hypothetical protein
MGQYSDIQFAEELLRGREQRKFSQQQQLAQQAFDRRKELEMLLADKEWDRSMRDKAYFQRWDDVEAEGKAKEDAGGAKLAAKIMRDYGKPYDLDEEYKQSQIDKNNATTEYYRGRPTGVGGTSQDGVWSDAQINSRYMARRGELIRERSDAIKSVENNIMYRFEEGKAAAIDAIKAQYADLDERAWTFANSTPGTTGAPSPQGVGAGSRADRLMAEVESGTSAPEQPVGGVRRYDVETLAMDIASSWNAGKRDERMAAKELYDAVRNGQLSEDEAKEVMRRAREIAASGTLPRPMPQPGPEQERIRGYNN